jgi:hypothetical protein
LISTRLDTSDEPHTIDLGIFQETPATATVLQPKPQPLSKVRPRLQLRVTQSAQNIRPSMTSPTNEPHSFKLNISSSSQPHGLILRPLSSSSISKAIQRRRETKAQPTNRSQENESLSSLSREESHLSSQHRRAVSLTTTVTYFPSSSSPPSSNLIVLSSHLSHLSHLSHYLLFFLDSFFSNWFGLGFGDVECELAAKRRTRDLLLLSTSL